MTVHYLSSPLLAIGADNTYGGSINELHYNGLNLIDAHDTGRLLQTALQIDGGGEGNNPTQGGSAANIRGMSPIIYEFYDETEMVAECQMAYWQPYGGKTVSDTYCATTTRIGFGVYPNVFHDHVVLLTDTAKGGAAVEVRTAYVPMPLFTRLNSLNLVSGLVSPLEPDQQTQGNGKEAVIVGNTDLSLVLGMWSPSPNVVQLGLESSRPLHRRGPRTT